MPEMMQGLVKAKPEVGAEYRTDLPIPEVGARDVLVHVKAVAICGTDQHIYNWTAYAQERCKLPMIFGHEFAGDVVAVGSEVTEVKIGDRVAGETHIPCNHCYQCETDNRHICENMKIIGVHTDGAYADYISFPADDAYKISDDLDYQKAALMEPMGVGVHGVDKGEVKDKDIVIYGCGPIGLMAVGAAKVFGAKKITAIDIFDNKLETAKQMGADLVINSKTEDAVKLVMDRTGHGADVVIDYTGNNAAYKSGFAMLKKGGRFVMVGLPNGETALDLSEAIIYKEATVIGVTGREMYKTWEQCEEILKNPLYNADATVGGVYRLSEYKKAFDAIFAGASGRMILIP